MLKNIKYLIGIMALTAMFSCCPHKNAANNETSSIAQNKAKLSPDYKMDSIEVAYTEKLINDPGIKDTKGSLTVEELGKLLPIPQGDYKTRPISSSKMDDDGSIVVIVKGQYIKSDNTIITVDITDYSPQKKVLKPEIYDTAIPETIKFRTTL